MDETALTEQLQTVLDSRVYLGRPRFLAQLRGPEMEQARRSARATGDLTIDQALSALCRSARDHVRGPRRDAPTVARLL